MVRTLTHIAKECKAISGATIAHLGRIQELDGARNPGAVLEHVEEVRAALRQMTREMDLLANRYHAILDRKETRA